MNDKTGITAQEAQVVADYAATALAASDLTPTQMSTIGAVAAHGAVSLFLDDLIRQVREMLTEAQEKGLGPSNAPGPVAVVETTIAIIQDLQNYIDGSIAIAYEHITVGDGLSD